jgi:nucleotide-binding universal stress UspA family protein
MSPAHNAVVVGIDGSAEARLALEWAVREAVLRHRPLHVLHAFVWPLLDVPLEPSVYGPPDGGLRHAAERLVREAADEACRLAPGLTVTAGLMECAASAALVEESKRAAVVVVGNRGLGGFTGLLVGSTGVQVAAHAACPVVVVRSGTGGSTGGRVLVGVDGGPTGEAVLAYAFEQAAWRGFGVTAVHAWHWPVPAGPGDLLPVVYDVAELRDEEERLLGEALAGWREKYPDVPVQRRLVEGRPGEVLVAESAGADLVVVGSRGRGGFAGLLLGSTSQQVLQHAGCPVAIVRSA